MRKRIRSIVLHRVTAGTLAAMMCLGGASFAGAANVLADEPEEVSAVVSEEMADEDAAVLSDTDIVTASGEEDVAENQEDAGAAEDQTDAEETSDAAEDEEIPAADGTVTDAADYDTEDAEESQAGDVIDVVPAEEESDVYVPSFSGGTLTGISPAEVTLNRGQSIQLQVTTKDNEERTIEWISADSTVVSVDSKGVVQGLNTGTVKITAKDQESGDEVECTVTVTDWDDEVHLDYNNADTPSYFKNGLVDTSFTGLANKKCVEDSGWYYMTNGVKDSSFAGFAKNKNGWYYVENGKVYLTTTVKMNAEINGVTADWRIDNSAVIGGLQKNSEGKLIFADPEGNLVTKDKKGRDITGFAQYGSDWYYVENGLVTEKKTDVIKGTVRGKTSWWYVKNSKVTAGPDAAKNKNGFYYINKNGEANITSFTGFVQQKTTKNWYYAAKGKISLKRKGVIKGKVNGVTAYWYVENSQVQFKKTTLGKNDKGWWYVKKGKVDMSYTGLAKNLDTGVWYYVAKGKVNFNYAGIVKNLGSKWRVRKGKVDLTFTGIDTFNGTKWYFKKGKLQDKYNGKVTYKGARYIVKNGKATVDDGRSYMIDRAQGYSSSTGWLVLVDKWKHKVGVFSGSKGNWTLKRYYSVATGTATPIGQYNMGARWDYYDSAAGNRCWYCITIKGHYLFHSVLCWPGYSYPKVRNGTVNATISHGCIRQPVADAKWMYDNVPRNTKIVIY